MLKKFFVAAVYLAVVLSLQPPVAASAARLPSISASLSASSTSVPEFESVRLTVKASRLAKGATVRLQKSNGGSWSTIAAGKLNRKSKKSFWIEAQPGNNVYRAKVARTYRSKGTKTAPVTVVGVEEEEPTCLTDPDYCDSEKTLADYTKAELRGMLLAEMNKRRNASTMDSFIQESRLDSVAQAWSDEQARLGMSHKRANVATSSPEGLEIQQEFVTFNGMPSDAVEFMGYLSREMLLGKYKYVGIGVTVYDKDKNLAYWTVELANEKAVTPPPPPPPPPSCETDPSLCPQEPNISDYTLDELRYELNILINDYRRANGKGALNQETSVNALAQDWSNTQDANNQSSYRPNLDSHDTSTIDFTSEYVTIQKLPQTVFDEIKASYGSFLLTDDFYIGIGMAPINDEWGYWTIDLAKKKSTTPSDKVWTQDEARSYIFAKTNEFRRDNGKASLVLHGTLNTVAQNWTNYMASSGYFGHNNAGCPSASNCFYNQYPAGWTRAGENVAAGYTPDKVVAGWIASDGHRANLLGDYTHIGIGFAYSSKSYPTYFTQNFAKY